MTDVIVIGCGGGGAVLAKELAEQGLDVVALEAGPFFENRRGPTVPTSDPADLDPSTIDEGWTGLFWDMDSPVDGKFRWGPVDRTQPPYARTMTGRMLGVNQVAAVGGSTVHYDGVAVRATRDSVDDQWPFDHRELHPYYDWVESILPVSTWEPQACKDTLLVHFARKIGLDASFSPLAIVRGSFESLPPNPTAEDFMAPSFTGCVMCGHCNLGCHHPRGARVEEKAKRGTDVSYVPLALQTGRFEVRPGCFVRRIVTAAGEARAVTYIDPSGNEVTEDAEVIVLSAGAIESPRLWLNSGLPNGVGDGPVGRYLMTHFYDFAGALFPFQIDRFKGPVQASEVVVRGAGKFGAIGFDPAIVSATSFAVRFGHRIWGLALKRYMEEYRSSFSVAVSTADEPDAANRITLDVTRPPDVGGLIPKLTYNPTPETVRRRETLVSAAFDVLRAAGAREETIFRSDAWGVTSHPMGTMRMGLDPTTSVVDASCEAHLVHRLFVADNSVFVTSLGGMNPTLTTQALASRTAEKIAAKYFGIAPWIRS